MRLPKMDNALPSGAPARLVGLRGKTDRDSEGELPKDLSRRLSFSGLLALEKQCLHKRYMWFQSSSVNMNCANDSQYTLEPWCSGYHVCLTRSRSPVRSWPASHSAVRF